MSNAIPPKVAVVLACPLCGGAVHLRERYDAKQFLGCAEYPECRWTAPVITQVKALAEKVSELETERRRLMKLLDAARGAA